MNKTAALGEAQNFITVIEQDDSFILELSPSSDVPADIYSIALEIEDELGEKKLYSWHITIIVSE